MKSHDLAEFLLLVLDEMLHIVVRAPEASQPHLLWYAADLEVLIDTLFLLLYVKE